MRYLKLMTAALFVISPFAAKAMPIAYSLILEVDTVLDFVGQPSDPVYQVSNEYFGSFIIDDSIMDTDGMNKPGDLLAFAIGIEDYLGALIYRFH